MPRHCHTPRGEWLGVDPLLRTERSLKRFAARVVVDGDCWLWAGEIGRSGYGYFYEIKKHVAHRWYYEQTVGPVPDGLELDHLCRVRHCVNPDHLEPVTHAENVRRGMVGDFWRQKTYCRNGHEYSAENTYWSESTGRLCRTCQREQKKERRRRKRAAGLPSE